MIPTLFASDYDVGELNYDSDAPQFPEHGVVDLVDCIECIAEQTEDEESEWEMAFTYPVTGNGFAHLKLDAIVVVKANNYQENQAFRIYAINKRTSKTVEVKCQHISYDMVNVPVKHFKVAEGANDNAENPKLVLQNVYGNTIYGTNWKKKHHFHITTDIKSKTKFELTDPKSMRAVLLDGDDSAKGTYGGDLIFNNYKIQLKKVGGEDRGVVINYGVDLIDMEQEENNSEMITGILPYYKRSSNDSKYATEPIIYGDIVYGPGTYKVQKIQSVDLSEHFPDSVPSKNDLKKKAQEWVKEEEIGEPEISLTLTYANIGQDVRMHDAIEVRFPAFNIATKAKVVKYKYNVLLERVEEVEVGHAKDSKAFNLMDASKLRKGLIPPERVGNESITNNKIAKGGVGKGKIGEQAVGTSNIQLGAINHSLLSGKTSSGGAAVQSDNIEDGAVGEDEIAKDAVTASKVKDGEIKEAKIGSAAVAWDKLKKGTGQPVTKINALETDMAYVNKLFVSTAEIDNVYAKHVGIPSGGTFTWKGNSTYEVEVEAANGAHYYVIASRIKL